MTTIAATFSREIRRPRATQRMFSRPSYRERFCYFIEISDWDETILARVTWVDRICFGVLISAVLCFTPVLINVFLG
ncbi:MAG: hypothetical protein HY742_08955 [Deltaproteobacteria bacterium]|nr:hypothetical protein [Deltaproteobacteria bacterium]